MNNQRYGQQSRPANPAGPTIRAGLSVQELKAMTAMRVAHDHDPSKSGVSTHDGTGQFRNPASSYQTATPQQLHAAGIQPLVVNNQPLVRQKSSTLNSFPVYASSVAYPDQHLVGQNRPYNYDDLNAPAAHRSQAAEPAPGTGMSLSSYAKASSTAGTAVPSYSSQQILPSRGAMPQINSVEDVKEMTRLRMLMSERDAFFESGASTRGLTTAADPVGADLDLSESRLSKHFGSSTGGGIPSSSSYDSYDFAPSSDDGRGGRGYSLNAPAPQAFSIPSAQAPQGYGAGKTMQQSASLGGLGVRGTTLGHSAAGLTGHGASGLTGHTGSYAAASNNQGLPYVAQGGLAGSTVRGVPHGHLPTAHPGAGHAAAPLSLTGSSVVGSRRPPTDSRPLAPLTQHPSPAYGSQGSYGSPYQQSPVDRSDLDLGLGREPPRRDLGRGIERELMLSSQLPVHGHGLTGGIDRLERALNGHAPQGNHHGLFEEPHSHYPAARLHNGHHNQEYDHFLGAPQRSLGAIGNLNAPRVEPSLHGLLSAEAPTAFRHDLFHPQDSLFGSPKAPSVTSPQLSGHHAAPGLLEPLSLQSHSHKVVLNPLDVHSPTPPLAARRESPSPILLAPLTPSPEKEKKVSPTAAAAGVRKLNTVPKAATFSTVETTPKKVSSPPLRDQSEVAPLSPSTHGPRSEKVHAFGDMTLPKGLGVKVDGIASPSVDSSDAHTPSPQARKASIVKAHTTSRLPIDTSASSAVLSPKLLIIKNKMSSASNSCEHTPPPTSGIDRSASDCSGGMNYLASEMAEMVLDTPAHGNKFLSGPQLSSHSYTWDDDRDHYLGSVEALLSRDNSNDFGRILGGLNDLSEGSASNNGHYKRSNSISYSEHE